MKQIIFLLLVSCLAISLASNAIAEAKTDDQKEIPYKDLNEVYVYKHPLEYIGCQISDNWAPNDIPDLLWPNLVYSEMARSTIRFFTFGSGTLGSHEEKDPTIVFTTTEPAPKKNRLIVNYYLKYNCSDPDPHVEISWSTSRPENKYYQTESSNKISFKGEKKETYLGGSGIGYTMKDLHNLMDIRSEPE